MIFQNMGETDYKEHMGGKSNGVQSHEMGNNNFLDLVNY
jgi:hypothetical protein